MALAGPKFKPFIFQFKISLKYPKPLIWRRLLVPGDFTFKDLHLTIQNLMGWSNSHMYKFGFKHPETGNDVEVGGVGNLGYGDWLPLSTKLLEYFVNANDKATYDYDFGDTWHHNILLEKILIADPQKKYPQCTAGRRATPPEHAPPYGEEEEEYDPEAFDAKLIIFKNCRDFLATSQSGTSGQMENSTKPSVSPNSQPGLAVRQKLIASNASQITNRNSGILPQKRQLPENENSAAPESQLGHAIRQKLMNSCANANINSRILVKMENTTNLSVAPKCHVGLAAITQKLIEFESGISKNSNINSAISILPRKKQLLENKNSTTSEVLVLTSEKETNSSPTLVDLSSIEDVESVSTEPEERNVSTSTKTNDDAEDYYGKFIAAQMREIKDLSKRDELRIEIQQVIMKYKFPK